MRINYLKMILLFLYLLKFPTPDFTVFQSSNEYRDPSVYRRFGLVEDTLISVVLLILPFSGLAAY